jgi:hypothetical protein
MPPKILRDVANLGSQPAALHDSALVLIDCQNAHREGSEKFFGVDAARYARSLLMWSNVE